MLSDMGMMINRRRAYGGKKGLLPSGYVQLEYIESTEKQYIDTGFKPNSDTRVVTDIMVASYVTENPNYYTSLFGARAKGDTIAFCEWMCSQNSPSTMRSDYGVQLNARDCGTSLLAKKIKIDKNKNVSTYSYNGTVLATITSSVQTFNTPYNLYIFRANSAGSPGGFPKTRVYSFKIYDNGTLVRDFIPAKNSSNVVGMYDTVSEQFFTNAGTGTFIAGSEV